jgi:hypothetical protein
MSPRVGRLQRERPHEQGETGAAAPRPLRLTLKVNPRDSASRISRGRSAIPRCYLIIVRVRPHLPWKILGDGLLVWPTREEAEKAAEAYREALPHQEWKVVPQGET